MPPGAVEQKGKVEPSPMGREIPWFRLKERIGAGCSGGVPHSTPLMPVGWMSPAGGAPVVPS